METLLRVHASPVPTQITFGFVGSMAIAPIDWTGCRSKTGLKVVPPLTDFHTPPLAVAAYTVSRAPSRTAASAAMRPLIAAEPMLRAPSPEIVSESTCTGAGCCAGRTRATAASSKASARAEGRGRPIRGFIIDRSSLVRRRCAGARLREPLVVEGDVGLDLLVRDFPPVLAAPLARLE